MWNHYNVLLLYLLTFSLVRKAKIIWLPIYILKQRIGKQFLFTLSYFVINLKPVLITVKVNFKPERPHYLRLTFHEKSQPHVKLRCRIVE